jgi:hypothetical protein
MRSAAFTKSRWASNWFAEGLLAGQLGFAGEESAGSWFLRRDGGVSGPPIYPPLINDKDTTVTPKGADDVEITFRAKPDPGAAINAAHLAVRLGEHAEWTSLGAATRSDDGDDRSQLWQLTWKPSKTIGAHAGDNIA